MTVQRRVVPHGDGNWLTDTRIPQSADLDRVLRERGILHYRQDPARLLYPRTERDRVDEVAAMIRHGDAPAESEVLSVEFDEEVPEQRLQVDGSAGGRSLNFWLEKNKPFLNYCQAISRASGLTIKFVGQHQPLVIPAENEVLISVFGNVLGRGTPNQPNAGAWLELVFDGVEFPSFRCWKRLNPSEDAIVITDDNGVEVAEVTHQKVGMLMDFNRGLSVEDAPGSRVWLSLLVEKILSRAVEICVDKKQCNEHLLKAQAQKVKKQKNAWVSLISRRADTEVNQVKTRMTEVTNRRKAMWLEMVDLTREAELLEQRMVGFGGENSSATTKAEKEFAKLLEIPEVVDLEVRADGLKFETSNIICTDPLNGRSFSIGEFSITLNMSGDVKFINRNNSKTSDGFRWDHPHVKDNNPCWGNIDQAVVQYLAKLEFGAAMVLIIAYLQTVNSTDAFGKNINLWFDDEVKKGEIDVVLTA